MDEDEDVLLFSLKDDTSGYSDAIGKLVLEAKFYDIDIEVWDSKSYDGWIAVWAEARQAGPEASVYNLLDGIAFEAGTEWDMTDEAESALTDFNLNTKTAGTKAEDLVDEADETTSWYKGMIESGMHQTDLGTSIVTARQGDWMFDPDDRSLAAMMSSIMASTTKEEYESDPVMLFTEDGPEHIEDFVTVNADMTMTASDGTAIASVKEAREWLESKLASTSSWFDVHHDSDGWTVKAAPGAPADIPLVELRDDGSLDSITVGAQCFMSIDEFDEFIEDMQEARMQIEQALV